MQGLSTVRSSAISVCFLVGEASRFQSSAASEEMAYPPMCKLRIICLFAEFPAEAQ